MAEDISPVLLKKIEQTFHRNLKAAGVTQKVMVERARDGTLKSVHQYTKKVGKSLAGAFLEEITPEVLPDGVFYYNIARKVVIPPFEEVHGMVSDVADAIQARQNQILGIGLKPVRPPLQMDRLDGIIDILTAKPLEEVYSYFNEPIRNLVDHFGDYHVERNIEVLDNSGVGVGLVRIADSTSCEWCAAREGTYQNYREAQNNDAFARHEGCRCQLIVSGGGTSGRMRARGNAFVRN